MKTLTVLLIFATLLLAPPAALHAAQANDRGVAYFREWIEPLLRENCYKCHSHEAEKIKGALVLDSRQGWADGGDSGPAILPGDPGKSLLLEMVSHPDNDARMPPAPEKRLAAEDIERLRRWISLGAPDPRTSASPALAEKLEQGRRHWAYQPLAHVKPPAGPDGSDPAVVSPIDRFVQAKLATEGLRQAREADRHTLLRRVTLDLTGLPPTLEEIAQFTADERPDAFVRVVDRLLASPEFGVHWARHWLDLACYADTVDSAQMPMREAWRYRDYVVDSFNRDKPLDRFITEQLAGDLLPAADAAQRREQLIAVGFLAIGPWFLSEQDKEQLRMDVVDHQIMRVGRVFLGMTLDCARCHDHKFDPITTRDYYAMAGIFGSTETLRGRLRSNLSGVALSPIPETESERALREAAFGPYREQMTEAGKKLEDLRARHERAKAELAACPPDAGEKRQELEAAVAATKKELDEQDGVVRLLDYHQPAPPETYAVCDVPGPADGRINLRGSPRNLGPAVPRGFIAVIANEHPSIAPKQSGRLELARWLTAADQPVTPRVLANRIWHHLIGAGIVRSVDYFGVRGDRPTHPELLDYLATRLQTDQRWRLKAFIREIVLSQTYRMASSHDEAAAARDPENKLLWRAHRRRLDAEMLRDALLAASGKLSHERGGEAMPLRVKGNLKPGDPINPPTVPNLKLSPEQLARRTLYLPIFRAAHRGDMAVLGLFDFPSPAEPTGARRVTAVPTQSL
ncbi:MAG: DUF1549 domain-containing protein, partial [Dongiaceae bacterium]